MLAVSVFALLFLALYILVSLTAITAALMATTAACNMCHTLFISHFFLFYFLQLCLI